jgi:AraC-like DNA-binding protein
MQNVQHPNGRPAWPLPDPLIELGDASELRMGPLLPVPGLMRDLGVDPAPLLASLNLDAALFDHPENRASYAKLSRLLQLCALATGCPHFGLLVGQRFDGRTLGALNELMRNCSSVGDALECLVLYLNWHDPGAVPVLLRLGSAQVCLGYSINQSATPGATQVYGRAMTIALLLLRQLCGSDWRATEVSLAHAAPQDAAPYELLFDAPVRFDAELSAVSFHARWLAQRIDGADPVRHAEIDARLRASVQAQDTPLSGQVQRALHRMIFAGTDSAAHLARFFGLHERALRRRLADEGTSLQQIGRQTRFELAAQLLRNTRLPAAQIAFALHYSDAAAFSRAFKRWTGATPIEWRAAGARAARSADMLSSPPDEAVGVTTQIDGDRATASASDATRRE